jgi:uncharacterized protein YjlB
VLVEGDCGDAPLRRGETVLLPASVGACALDPAGKAVVLDAYLP